MARSKKRKKKGVAVRAPGAPAVHTPPRPQPVHRVTASRTELYAGTVPHPEHAQAFENILPGSFGRFLAMAEKQGDHRQRMERKFLNFNGASQILGVVIAGAVVLAGMWFGYDLLMHDKKVEGLTAMLTPLGVIGAAFIGARISQAKEKRAKARAEQS
jgi:uncharacterized membrane protein